MAYLIKLSGERYYLTEGPSGYAMARSKAKAKKFPTRKAAVAFSKVIAGDIEIVELGDQGIVTAEL